MLDKDKVKNAVTNAICSWLNSTEYDLPRWALDLIDEIVYEVMK